MPYDDNDELPEGVQKHLPTHAQTIYRKAFNNAEDEYDTEEQAHKVAWSAVKHQYEKGDDGDWHRK